MTDMKRLLLIAAALFAATAALGQSTYYEQRRSLFDALPVRSGDIVFLGNSLTDGCEWAELFDNRHIKNRGISGDRADWMLRRIDTLLAGHPKKLFLLIGTNDLAAGRTPQQIVDDIRRLVERFRTESRWTKIYIQSLLPVNGRVSDRFKRHYAHAAEIVETNRLLEALCAEEEIFYLDIHSALADENGDLDQAYTNDGLHLTGAGYMVWRDKIKPYVK